MTLRAEFDHMALTYDEDFTSSSIGTAQRSQVWHYLNNILPKEEKWNILEVNCGTGEDALQFAKRGHSVMATDVSEKMIEEAIKKSKFSQYPSLKFECRDARNLEVSGSDYDLIFSNFGGLNCLSPDELGEFLNKNRSLLKPGGRMILVLMPKFCLMESLYFLSRFRFTDVFRRMTTKKVEAKIGSEKTPIWYYKAKYIGHALKGDIIKKRGIGCLVPPSYLEGKIPSKLLSFLNKCDHFLLDFSFPAYLSDHFLIDIKIKE